MSPAVGADGAIYVGTNGGTAFAIEPDGRLRWSAPVGGTDRGGANLQ